METFKEPLTKEEEEYWVEKASVGSKEAKDVLVERNLRLVAHIVKKYNQNDRDMEDLLSVGTIGLIKAINTFKNSKGNRLVTYASKCIDNEILMYLRYEKKKQRETSLYEPIGTDKEGNAISLLDVIESEQVDVVEMCDLDCKTKKLYEIFDKVLTKREQEIISKRYGLFGYKESTQRELAASMDISRSYVSRIEKKALEKLRKTFENDVAKIIKM
ncbi:MAG: RNA polymerase sporulation sigma factor SigK [Lachnospiraceae bacterium]|nr:RNA polymerase sporulation sigma factor SigK [Lachnospiraceae bacterium]